ncbi:unnamed protein product [Clonostachys solani]|uniref:Uncharacterized protein n=1 Tax=Clonostachys solani TaxID=160281 RepID=A0A9N9ZIA0_9HYPO|nr:unnamed protein product [Clonostachys solani]
MSGSIIGLVAFSLHLISAAAQNGSNVELIDPYTRFSDLNLSLPLNASFPVLQSTFETQPDCGEQAYHGYGRLQGLRALITGGDSGIGRAVVIAYLREGATVTINYLPEEESDAQALSSFVAEEGYTIERIPGDLRNETFCADLVTEAHSRMGGIDIFVGNAGYSGVTAGPNAPNITNHPTEQIQRTFETNFYANLWLARAVVPLLPRGGSIIYTASGTVSNPGPGNLDYGSSKAALVYFMRCLAMQVASSGIRVNAVAPALAYTPFLAASGFTPENLSGGSSPIGRIEQPVELSPLYVDLAAPDKTYISGEVYTAKGGSLGL